METLTSSIGVRNSAGKRSEFQEKLLYLRVLLFFPVLPILHETGFWLNFLFAGIFCWFFNSDCQEALISFTLHKPTFAHWWYCSSKCFLMCYIFLSKTCPLQKGSSWMIIFRKRRQIEFHAYPPVSWGFFNFYFWVWKLTSAKSAFLLILQFCILRRLCCFFLSPWLARTLWSGGSIYSLQGTAQHSLGNMTHSLLLLVLKTNIL